MSSTFRRLGQSELLPRYIFAESLYARRRVLEIGAVASTLGQSARFLSTRGARTVVACDVDLKAVEDAQATLAGPNLRFRAAIYDDLEAHSFDLVIVADLAQYVRAPELLKEIVRLLDPRGYLMGGLRNPAGFSLANVMEPEGADAPPTYGQLLDALTTHFRSIEVATQSPVLGYQLSLEKGEGLQVDGSLAGVSEAAYFVVLAGNEPVRNFDPTWVQLPPEPLAFTGGKLEDASARARNWQERSEKMKEALERSKTVGVERDGELQKYRLDLEAAREAISRLTAQLESAAMRPELARGHDELTARIGRVEGELQLAVDRARDAEARLGAMRAELEAKDRARRDAAVEALSAQEASRLERARRDEIVGQLQDARGRLTQSYEELRRLQDALASDRVEGERAKLQLLQALEAVANRERDLKEAQAREVRLAESRTESLQAVEHLQARAAELQRQVANATDAVALKESERNAALRGNEVDIVARKRLEQEVDAERARAERAIAELKRLEVKGLELDTDLLQAKSERARLAADLELLKASEKHWQDRAQDVEQKLALAQVTSDTASAQIEALEVQKRQAEEAWVAVERQLRADLQKAQGSRAPVEQALGQAVARSRELEEDLARVVEERDDVRAALGDLERVRQTDLAEVESLNSRLKDLGSQNKAFDDAVGEAQRQVAETREEAQSREAELQGQLDATAQKLTALEAEHASLRKDAQLAVERVGEREAKVAELSRTLRETEDEGRASLEARADEIRALTEKLGAAERTLTEVNPELSAVKVRAEQSAAALARETERASGLGLELDRVQVALKSATTQRKDVEAQLETLEQARAATQAELAQANEQLAERARELAQAQAQTAERKRELDQLTDQLSTRSREHGQTQEQFSERSRELEQTREQLGERARELEQARAQLGDRARELEQARAQDAERTRDLEQARELGAERARELEQSREQLAERARELEAARELGAERTRELEQTRVRLASVEQAAEQTRGELARSLKETGEESAERITAVQREREALREQLERERSQLTTERDEAQAALREERKRSASLEEQASRVGRDVEEGLKSASQTAVERDQARAERDAALNDRDRARTERDDANSARQEAQAARDAAVDEATAARAEREQAVVEREATLTAQTLARREAEQADAERDALMVERDAARRERDAAVAERDGAGGQRDSLRAELETTTARRDEAIRTLAKQAERLAQLEGDLELERQRGSETASAIGQELELARGEVARASSHSEETEAELARVGEGLAKTEATLAQEQAARAKLEAELESLQSRAEGLARDLGAATQELESAREEAQRTGGELSNQLRDTQVRLGVELARERQAVADGRAALDAARRAADEAAQASAAALAAAKVEAAAAEQALRAEAASAEAKFKGQVSLLEEEVQHLTLEVEEGVDQSRAEHQNRVQAEADRDALRAQAEAERDALKGQLEKLQASAERQQAELLTQGETQLAAAEQRRAEVQAALDQQLRARTDAEGALAAARLDLEQTRSEAATTRQRVLELDANLEVRGTQLAEAKARAASDGAAIGDLETRLADLGRARAEGDAAAAARAAEDERKQAGLAERIAALERQTAERDAELVRQRDATTRRFEEAEAAWKSARAAIEAERDTRVGATEAQLAERQKRLETTQAELKAATSEIDKARSEARGHQAGKLRLETDAEKVRAELTELRAVMAEKGGESQAMAEGRERAETELKELRARLESLETARHEAVEAAARLEKQAKTADERASGLDTRLKETETRGKAELDAQLAARRQAEEMLLAMRSKYGEIASALEASSGRSDTTEAALAGLREQVDELNGNLELMDGERVRLASEIERLENERSANTDRHEREMGRLREEFERAAARAADGDRAVRLEAHSQRLVAELAEKQGRIEQMLRRIGTQETEIAALRRLAGAPDARKGKTAPSVPAVPRVMPLTGKPESGIAQALKGVQAPTRKPGSEEVEVFELEIEDTNSGSEELLVLEEEITDPGTKKR